MPIPDETGAARSIACARKLAGPSVELALLSVADAPRVADYYERNRAHLEPYEPRRDPAFYSVDYQRRLLEEQAGAMADGRGLYWGMFDERLLVGKINLMNVVRYSFQSAFLAYSVDAEHQSRGLATEAAGLVVDFAFGPFHLHRLEASTLVDNRRSQAVLSANGFIRLGLNRDYLEIDGRWRDHITFYQLVDDWLERRGR